MSEQAALTLTITYIHDPDSYSQEEREFFWRYRAIVYGHILEGYAMSLLEARQTADERIDKRLKTLEPETW